MMRIAISLLCATLAFAVFVAARYTRAATLRRLTQIIMPAFEAPQPNGAAIKHSFELSLPRALVRQLRVLDVNPSMRGAAAIAAAYLSSIAFVGAFCGAVPAVIMAMLVCLLSAATLSILANRRINELAVLMPSFFDRVRQLLVVGNSLPTAFARALHASQPKFVAFFSPAMRRAANGAGFTESIQQSAEDIALYEMHLFSAAIATNMRFGGSLTHSLSNLVLFLRKRASVERELRASTALIRSSAWVLGLLPILVAALIVGQNRAYAQWFVADPVGKSLLVYCVFSQLLGAIVMRAIIRSGF